MDMHPPTMGKAASGPATHPLAGVAAGLIAGAAYLAAQMVFAATVHHGSGAEPLQRIGAMLLGEDALPPGELVSRVVGIALLIHFGLSIVFGRIVDAVVGTRPLPPALLRGAALGLLLYAIDYWLLAPVLFPWFADGRSATAMFDHALFGMVAAGCDVVLRRRLAPLPAT